MPRGPVAGPLRQLRVPRVARLQSFAENFFELRRERINVADARRAGRHILLGVLLKLDEIEVITAVFYRCRFGQRGRRTGEQRHARRQRERLLRPGQQHVNAERVEFNFGRRERTDRIHDEHHVGILSLERGDVRERTHHAGRSFVVNQRERVELSGGESGVHLFGANRRAPRHLEGFGRFAAAFGNIKPLVGERPAHAVEHLPGNKISDRAFHHAPGRRGAQINQLFRGQERLQLRLDFRQEVFEPLPAMADHRRAEGAERFLAHLDRAGDVQFYVSHLRSLNR